MLDARLAPPASRAQTAARWLLGGMLVGAGIGHLTWARAEFQAQVPRSLPLGPDAVVLLSGVAEIALGAALVGLPKRRVALGAAAAAFFAAVFPGNVAQYLNRADGFGLDTDAKRFARLFGQPVLVAWALWSTGAWQAWRTRRQRGDSAR